MARETKFDCPRFIARLDQDAYLVRFVGYHKGDVTTYLAMKITDVEIEAIAKGVIANGDVIAKYSKVDLILFNELTKQVVDSGETQVGSLTEKQIRCFDLPIYDYVSNFKEDRRVAREIAAA